MNPAALAVRNHGTLLLFVPIIWTISCLLMERSGKAGRTILCGLLVLAASCGFLGWTSMNPFS